MGNYEFDKIDLKLISILQDDARTPFLEIARRLDVSGGTIHVRLAKLEEAGVIDGYTLKVNEKRVGLDVCCLVGVTLKSTSEYQNVLKQLKKMKEVVDAWYTTGSYSLMLRVYSESMETFHLFLLNKLQSIKEIQSTETFVVMNSPISRSVEVS